MSDTAVKGNWFAKHKVLTIIGALVVLVIIITATNNKSTPTTNTANTTKTSAQTSAQAPASKPASKASSAPAQRKVKGTATTLGAGTFTGGKDVAVGLYDVTASAGQSGNFQVDGTDSYNEILGSDASMNEVPKVRVQISNGDKITISSLSSVTFTPVTTPFVTAHAAATLYAGTFTVGQDIGAGRYTVTPGSGQSGNFMVDGNDSYNEILGSDSSMGEVPSVAVTLTVGDTVTISGLSQVNFTPSN